MKLLTLLIITLLCVSLDIVSCAKSKLKLHSKKYKSMFELLEGLESPSKKAKAKAPHKAISDPFIFLKSDKSLDLIHQGWLRVSHPNLKNLNRYPRINLPNWQQQEIPTGDNFFRKNHSYQGKSENGPPTNEYFWMRLTKRNFFYSLSKDSISAVEAMPIKEFKTAVILKDYARDNKCFKVIDRKSLNWVLCARTVDERNTWVCRIKELLRQADYLTCSKVVLSDDIPVITKKIFQPVIMLAQASPMCNENFDYKSLGANWECDCREGNY
jgi:hypothetical protein